jgi:Ca2+:H+ antiporter
VARRLLWAGLALAPLTIVLDLAVHPSKTAMFVLAAIALIPLAWMIGEATEQAGEHTGPRIAGLLNASFGNAPELIIALIAVSDTLPNVVRGSLVGSVVSNLLLVFGAALLLGDEGRLERRSLIVQTGLVAIAVVVLLLATIPGWHGNPERHSLADLSIGPAIFLLVIYLVITVIGVRRGERPEAPPEAAWSMRTSLIALGIATVATAWISEILVHSLEAFARAVGLSEFFIAIVIVAIVGNAAEHGGAIVIAYRANLNLAAQIAISSGAQVGLLVLPVVTLLSFAFAHPLTLAFRPVELAAMAISTVLVAVVLWDGRGRRWEGVLLVASYVGLAVAFYFSGDRGR